MALTAPLATLNSPGICDMRKKFASQVMNFVEKSIVAIVDSRRRSSNSVIPVQSG